MRFVLVLFRIVAFDGRIRCMFRLSGLCGARDARANCYE